MSAEALLQQDSPEAQAVIDYLFTVPKSYLSWREWSLLGGEGEETPNEQCRNTGLLVGSLRQSFFDKEESLFLRILGHLPAGYLLVGIDVAQEMIAKTIYRELTQQNGQGNYWIRAAKEVRKNDFHNPLYRLAAGYPQAFHDQRDFLSYVLEQKDPIETVSVLSSVVSDYLRETQASAHEISTELHAKRKRVTIGFIRALQLADTDQGFYSGLPLDVVLRLLEPIFDDAAEMPKKRLPAQLRSLLSSVVSHAGVSA